MPTFSPRAPSKPDLHRWVRTSETFWGATARARCYFNGEPMLTVIRLVSFKTPITLKRLGLSYDKMEHNRAAEKVRLQSQTAPMLLCSGNPARRSWSISDAQDSKREGSCVLGQSAPGRARHHVIVMPSQGSETGELVYAFLGKDRQPKKASSAQAMRDVNAHKRVCQNAVMHMVPFRIRPLARDRSILPKSDDLGDSEMRKIRA